jgi:hypothetical protein
VLQQPSVHKTRRIAVACATPPSGPARWSVRLLAAKLVDLEVVAAGSYRTVLRMRKTTALQPHLRKQWCLPPRASGAFVWRMEDVLEVYTRPSDPRRPQVGRDERPKQRLCHTRAPLPAKPGAAERGDYEYEHEGVVNGFLFCEPRGGRRAGRVSPTSEPKSTRRSRSASWSTCAPPRPSASCSCSTTSTPTHPGRPLRHLPPGGSQAPGRRAGDPPSPQAWELAHHRRD